MTAVPSRSLRKIALLFLFDLDILLESLPNCFQSASEIEKNPRYMWKSVTYVPGVLQMGGSCEFELIY